MSVKAKYLKVPSDVGQWVWQLNVNWVAFQGYMIVQQNTEFRHPGYQDQNLCGHKDVRH
jgi:hypothetical protein